MLGNFCVFKQSQHKFLLDLLVGSRLNFFFKLLRDENLTDFRHLACGEATRGIHGAVYTTGNAFGKAFPFGHLATTDFAKN